MCNHCSTHNGEESRPAWAGSYTEDMLQKAGDALGNAISAVVFDPLDLHSGGPLDPLNFYGLADQNMIEKLNLALAHIREVKSQYVKYRKAHEPKDLEPGSINYVGEPQGPYTEEELKLADKIMDDPRVQDVLVDHFIKKLRDCDDPNGGCRCKS